MSRRVVITGIGMINPMGHDVETVWSGLKESKSGVARTTVFDASNFPTKISAEVKNWSIAKCGEDVARWENIGRHTQFAIGAAKQAVSDSGVMESVLDPTRMGVYLGCGEGDQDFFAFTTMVTAAMSGSGDFDKAEFIRKGLESLNPRRELEQEPSMPSAHLASLFNAQGPNANCLTACAASSQAIGEATELIRRGTVDVMLSGGAHSMIHPFGVTGFNLLTALSTSNDEPTKASRPFDRLRDGFVLGEGSSMVVLEELEHAKKRGAHIYGEVLGYGTTADAFRITDTHPEGRGAISCMKMAMSDAKMNVEDIDYVNAHGTSTEVNDKVESLACRQVFGDMADKIPVSSTKSMMGHLIAAAGVTEAIVCLLAIRDNVLPPTINYENPDPNCDLDYVPNFARDAKVDVALNNSFGFGGQNITLCVGRFNG
ncbi:beta-ketoacyl-[acyl-carrier-protein] synthase family protein [Blastopirellula sp. JC732]|uniref:3-oxoacyl-[acyl-carrier-protein] synthase 2 n=1 Tax=Blastopirellula sediminis TaxID=2894196 RepID=A0A9X1MQN3_9BACT|nr:beta-ketoacyl-[acyl-carrier-protein] synthase family protein [Blastopirellula sediminis]MCC9606440.1 beta-ketoacyl-[acyl-carrier-protein] synthase family protein [Blastopirellula sediminis]MCC9630262.1 beta-ketoacyl-[acyl-carrier-protein] synthase family protein [Blastopirellula sediminis]